MIKHICSLCEMFDLADSDKKNSNGRLKSKLQLCTVLSMLICDSLLEGFTLVFPLCGFYFGMPLFLLPQSMERGLQRHHSNHVSAEIHLSTLCMSNISGFPPCGKIKYLVLHREIHSKVLSWLPNPWKSIFPF